MSTSQFDPRITAYFGDAVLQAGFMPLPHLFLRHYRELGLSHVQAMFILQLMEIAWDVGSPPTNVTRLAARMGVTARTIQLYSQEVHELGFVEIYDQFDDGGSQVENGYDLSPLFARLAALVPTLVPSGQPRTRRNRPSRTRQHDELSQSPMLVEAAPEGVQDISSPPVQNISSPPRTEFHPFPDQTITPPLKKDSGLNEEETIKNRLRTDQEQLSVVAARTQESSDESILQPTQERADGYSLRWNIPLAIAEIERSRAVLARMKLNANVVLAAAPALHPAETWSLWCYARGANLGPAWIASQIYDRKAQQPQLTAHASCYDEVGRLLAELDPADAEKILHLTADLCSEHDGRQRAEVSLRTAPPAHVAVFDAIWNVMAEQRQPSKVQQRGVQAPAARGRSGRNSKQVYQPGLLDPSVSSPPDERWLAAREHLAQCIPAEDWTTWLEPLALLELADDAIIIGAPNVFVRNHVGDHYVELLEKSMMQAFGRSLQVELVIGTPILA